MNKYIICFFTKPKDGSIKKYVRGITATNKIAAIKQLNEQLDKEKLLPVQSGVEDVFGEKPHQVGIKYVNLMDAEIDSNGKQKSYSGELLREEDSDGVKEDEDIWEECSHYTKRI
jgi:hypothetical protein